LVTGSLFVVEVVVFTVLLAVMFSSSFVVVFATLFVVDTSFSGADVFEVFSFEALLGCT